MLVGCNGVGGKDTLLARIDNEKVYQEDYTLLLKDKGKLRTYKNYFIYTNLYAKSALASRALSEYPELENEWKIRLKDIEPNLLTLVYQRYYATEKMTYTDAELRNFYDANRELFPKDSTGEFLLVRADVASFYHASKNPEKFSEYLNANINKNDTSTIDTLALKKSFADSCRKELQKELSNGILDKAHIGVQTLPTETALEYYNKHKDAYKTVDGYELYQVHGDSSELANLFTDSVTLQQFKAIAKANANLKKDAKRNFLDSGYVGRVKRDYALPYGIGLVDSLSVTLAGKEPGFVTPVLRSSQGEFYRFYLAGVVPSEQKPFDRVQSEITAGIKSGALFDIDTSVVLIMQKSEPIFTEKDLLRFNEIFFRKVLSRNLHERIIANMAENFAYAYVARELKLNHSWEYRALVRKARLEFICDRYLEKWRGLENISEDTLKALFNRVKSSMQADFSFERAKHSLRLIASFPKNLYEHDYYMCYRIIYAGKTFDQSILQIYSQNSKEYLTLLTSRLSAEAYANADVHLYDTSTPEYVPEIIADSLLKKADSLYKADKKSDAYYAYRNVMIAYAEVDSLFEKVAYEMAIIQGENEEYLDAEGEYYAFYTMWPNNANAEKAMFSRGFMLNENIGNNKKALEVLNEFLKKYPNSEYKESAEWLVDNIKSGGKLAEQLMQKISKED